MEYHSPSCTIETSKNIYERSVTWSTYRPSEFKYSGWDQGSCISSEFPTWFWCIVRDISPNIRLFSTSFHLSWPWILPVYPEIYHQTHIVTLTILRLPLTMMSTLLYSWSKVGKGNHKMQKKCSKPKLTKHLLNNFSDSGTMLGLWRTIKMIR